MDEPKNRRRFEGRTAIVTGSASGIGRQVVLDLAAEGANVVINDIDQTGMSEVAAEVEQLGARAISERCDVGNPREVQHLVEAAVREFAKIDILVNNAGFLATATIEESDDDLIARTLDVNLKGVLYAIRAATPHMKRQRYGKIINLSSIAGKNGDGSTTFAYGASKGAVMSLTRSAARELGPFNVNVNAVAPHAVMTPMMAYWTPSRRDAATERIPLGRLATPKDVSSVILFLASDDSAFITGETINVNGGFYMD